jgi:hypothetical protein
MEYIIYHTLPLGPVEIIPMSLIKIIFIQHGASVLDCDLHEANFLIKLYIIYYISYIITIWERSQRTREKEKEEVIIGIMKKCIDTGWIEYIIYNIKYKI